MTVIQQATALVALLGAIGGGVWAVEGRYATRALVAGEVRPLRLQYLELREDTLARRIFELRREQERRRLSDFEQEELDRLQQERRRMQDEREQLMGPRP